MSWWRRVAATMMAEAARLFTRRWTPAEASKVASPARGSQRRSAVFVPAAARGRGGMHDGSACSALVDWAGVRRGLPLIATTAVVGPVFARTAYMYSLRRLAVSRVALIQQSQPVFVALFSAFLLHALPSRREWTGGLLIIAGCLFLVQWRARGTRGVRNASSGPAIQR